MRDVHWLARAWEAYTNNFADKPFIKRVHTLIKDIQRNGYMCSYGKPEKLKGLLSGFSSVRIDKKNRLVFEVDDAAVSIIECGGHYDDK